MIKLAVIAILLIDTANCVEIKCKDDNNKTVDWFVVYKLPKLKSHNEDFIAKGEAYAYVTSDNYKKWIQSEKSINDSSSIIANTLNPLFEESRNNFYIVYNDEPPHEPKNNAKGHTKGVVMANENGGVWLVHSVPNFPSLNQPYFYPEGEMKYGQSFLCLSLNLQNLNEVGLQLQYNEPIIYAKNILKNLQVPDLIDAASDKTIKVAPFYRQTKITTENGDNFISFAKTRKFGKDLYEDWLAPALKTDLLVETWTNGPGKLPSNCTKQYKVKNIEDVSIINTKFKRTDDHSKWTVSENESWICLGDINRMEHQKVRGGGTVCHNNKDLSELYKQIVKQIEECSSLCNNNIK